MNQLLIVDRQFEVEKSFLFKKWLMRAICNAFFGPSMFFVQSRPIHITLTFIDISKLARWQLWNYFNISSWNHILTDHKNLQVVFNVRCNWKIFLIYNLVAHFTDFYIKCKCLWNCIQLSMSLEKMYLLWSILIAKSRERNVLISHISLLSH